MCLLFPSDRLTTFDGTLFLAAVSLISCYTTFSLLMELSTSFLPFSFVLYRNENTMKETCNILFSVIDHVVFLLLLFLQLQFFFLQVRLCTENFMKSLKSVQYVNIFFLFFFFYFVIEYRVGNELKFCFYIVNFECFI